jgi:hypothetical protein
MSSVVLVAFMPRFSQSDRFLAGKRVQVGTSPVDKPVEIPANPRSVMSMSIPSGSSAAAIGLSGMRAARLQLDSHAHNIANVQTPDFRRQVTTLTARPDAGGVDAQIGREAEASPPFDRLAEDLVGGRMSLYSFAANLRTVQTQDRMLGTLLDIQV